MTPLIIALVSFATALVAGVLLSKAFFTAAVLNDAVSREAHYQSLSNQRKRYRKQLITLHNRAQQKLSAQREKIADLSRKIEAVQENPHTRSTNKEFYDGKLVETLRVEIGVLRENLETRDERIGILDIEIKESHVKAQELLTSVNTWKERVTPLTKKLEEQRKIIDAVEGQSKNPDEASSDEESSEQENRIPNQPDDLKKIRGIGPALERRLNTRGVNRFEQIASMSEQDLSDLATDISVSPAVAERENWIAQARSLHDVATSTAQLSV
jgi:predicted flap endonuclease-1-like 5' DNA nuclease